MRCTEGPGEWAKGFRSQMMMSGEAGKVPENGYYLRKPLHFRKEGKIIKRQLELSKLGEASLRHILSSCAESCLDIHSHWG